MSELEPIKYLFITAIHNLKLEKPECRIPLVSGMISNKEGLLKDICHQVAERVAVMLANNKDESIEIYSEIKKGYSYRSKTAHGEALKGTEQEAMDLLVHLDEYLRRLMTFDIPNNLNPDKINEYFLKKLLGNQID